MKSQIVQITSLERRAQRLRAQRLGSLTAEIRGEMWLTVDGYTRHLLPGATFDIPAGTVHSERYGAEGATYRVGRREAVRQGS
jgi:hypothetical protein